MQLIKLTIWMANSDGQTVSDTAPRHASDVSNR